MMIEDRSLEDANIFLEQEIKQVLAENKRLKKVLRYYSDGRNFVMKSFIEKPGLYEFDDKDRTITHHFGYKARKELGIEIKEGKHTYE